MRTGSLIVLCAVFCTAFIGRAAVLAASIAEKEPATESTRDEGRRDRCIDGALAEKISKQIDWLQAQKAELGDKKRELEVLGGHVEKRVSQLEELNKSLAVKLEAVEASHEKKKAEVGAIYSQMKPAAASGIIGGMDPEFAAGLLLAMNEENASAILAALPPNRAYAITVLMAQGSAAK